MMAEVWNSLIAVTSYGAAKSLMGFITDFDTKITGDTGLLGG